MQNSLKRLPAFCSAIFATTFVASAIAEREIPIVDTPPQETVGSATDELADDGTQQSFGPVTPDTPTESGLVVEQYALEMLGIYESWGMELGSPDVVVAVIDSGIDGTHRDLATRMWVNNAEVLNGIDDDNNGFVDDLHGWDFVEDDNTPQDDASHGTHVAGIIAARGRFNRGIAGVANVTIMPLRVLDGQREGVDTDVIRAINYAVANGADVINVSLGGTEPNAALAAACTYAETSGVVVVAAVGNQATNQTLYPAGYRTVIGVGAVDQEDAAPQFSNWGLGVDVVAPGVGILSTVPNNRYGYRSGTSMATAYVAGIAALIKSAHPNMSPAQIRAAMVQNAVDVSTQGWDSKTGYGRVDSFKALSSAPFVDFSAELLPQADSNRVSVQPTNAQDLAEVPVPCGFGILPGFAFSAFGLTLIGRRWN